MEYRDGPQPSCAIFRSDSGPYSYSVKPGYANKPISYVSWYDAIRFVNWLQNGQGNGDTESGTYTITGGGKNSGSVLVPDVTTRTLWAAANSFHWLLPSENEWYKAAYYNSLGASYYSYPFQSNDEPAALAPPGTANSGNFNSVARNDGRGSGTTDVGAYSNSISPFGAFDMGGNVDQWDDTTIIVATNSGRGLRGGSWVQVPFYSSAVARDSADPGIENVVGVGFRVASVGGIPEPSTSLLAALACGVLWFARRRVQSNDAGI